jgi:hypothetical protein
MTNTKQSQIRQVAAIAVEWFANKRVAAPTYGLSQAELLQAFDLAQRYASQGAMR